jgi:DNA-binding PadR family transcriptional regulator
MLQGHLDSLLLAVVEDEPAHGYAIIDELRRRSGGTFDLPEGTVYPALHRLERAGLLRSDTTTVNGRQRRVYRLSRRGTTALSQQRNEWRGFAGAVSSVLKVSPA